MLGIVWEKILFLMMISRYWQH